MKKRLDVRCVEIGIFDSREKSKRAIMAGDIKVNGNVVCEPSFKVSDDDRIEIKKNSCPYVSRGGLKLKHALEHFKINLKGRVCLDVGVATGGFSHCMLMEGAKKVYGVDVGKGQVHEKVLKEERFVFIPHTNARYLKPSLFDEPVDFCAVDVSFISLKLIIPSLVNSVKKNAEVILLIKPQFELEAKYLKKGIVKDQNMAISAVDTIRDFISSNSFGKILGYVTSPIKGAKGNTEYLLYFINLKGI